MKHFKNEEKKTLEGCSDEELLCIVKSLFKGELQTHVSGTWHKSNCIHRNAICRVLPKPTKVFWDRAPEWARFFTKDAKGCVFWESEPDNIIPLYLPACSGDRSVSIPHSLLYAFCELGDEELPLLIERPEDE